MSAVESGSEVTYRCPRNATTWAPTTFTLELTATSGTDCPSQGSDTATVKVTSLPAVTVTPLNSPVSICETSTANHTDVVFQVDTDNGDPITVKTDIDIDGLFNCTLRGTADKGECVGQQSALHAVWPKFRGPILPCIVV